MNCTTALLKIAGLVGVSPDEKPEAVLRGVRKQLRRHRKFKDSHRRRLEGLLCRLDDIIGDFDQPDRTPDLRKQKPRKRARR